MNDYNNRKQLSHDPYPYNRLPDISYQNNNPKLIKLLT